MARPVKFPPTVHRHHSGQAFIRWHGQEIYLGKHGTPKAEAEYIRVLARLKAGQEAKPREVDGLTVNAVVAQWEERESPRLGNSREKGAMKDALKPLVVMFGDIPAADFRAAELETVQLAVAGGTWKEDAPRWSRRVVNRNIVRIRTVWRWAERVGLVPPGSWGNLRTLPGLKPNDARVIDRPARRAVSRDEVWDTIRVACPKAKAVLLLLYWSGMRPSELRDMRPGDIDKSDPRCWIYRPAKHKNAWRGQERFIVLGPKCIAVLNWWEEGPPDCPILRPRSGPKPYTDYGLAQLLRRSAIKAGVKGLQPYRLRHAAKDRITAQHGLDTARAVLGQRSLDTTNGYGTQVDLKTARRVAN